jgi:hypothetical protein
MKAYLEVDSPSPTETRQSQGRQVLRGVSYGPKMFY